MPPIRIAVTGSGFMGRTHADAANRLDDTEFVAVAGGRRAEKLAADYGAERLEDAAALTRAGANNVVAADVESAVEIVHVILGDHGASSTTVEQQLARIRSLRAEVS